MPMPLIIRQMGCHQIPEMNGMISDFDMAKLVNDYIFEHGGRGQNKQPIDMDIIVYAAAAPPAFLRFYFDRAWQQLILTGVFLHKMLYFKFCPVFIPAHQGGANFVVVFLFEQRFGNMNDKLIGELYFYSFQMRCAKDQSIGSPLIWDVGALPIKPRRETS